MTWVASDILWVICLGLLLWVWFGCGKFGGTKGTKAPLSDEESDVLKDEVEQSRGDQREDTEKGI
jgi:hypothetical protein